MSIAWTHKTYGDSSLFYHLLPQNRHQAIIKTLNFSKYTHTYIFMIPFTVKGDVKKHKNTVSNHNCIKLTVGHTVPLQ
jgi:hypothetical protein